MVGRPEPGAAVPAAPVRLELRTGRALELTVSNVGLACCAVEVVAAVLAGDPLLRRAPAGDRTAAGARSAGEVVGHVLVVSGTVTDRLAPAVLRQYHALPEPRYVLSFGACANSGGPYWDSYCVTPGVDRLVPVDVYVPGCPPGPQALLDGLRALEERIAAGAGS